VVVVDSPVLVVEPLLLVGSVVEVVVVQVDVLDAVVVVVVVVPEGQPVTQNTLCLTSAPWGLRWVVAASGGMNEGCPVPLRPGRAKGQRPRPRSPGGSPLPGLVPPPAPGGGPPLPLPFPLP
jgi:hypothetical protein